MKYSVIFTDTAKQDLREIAFYIAEKTKDKEVAINFINALREKANQLSIFPNVGTLPNDKVLKSLGYRFLVYKDYLLFYFVDEKQKKVYIMAIFNGKRDYIRVMKKYI